MYKIDLNFEYQGTEKLELFPQGIYSFLDWENEANAIADE